MRSLASVGAVALVVWSARLAGTRLLSRLGFRFQSRAEREVLGLGVGLGISVHALAALGWIGRLSRAGGWALVAGLVALGLALRPRAGWKWQVARSGRPEERPASSGERLLLMGFATTLLAFGIGYLLVALSPTLEGDSIAGYLLTAREYSRAGRILSVPYAYTDAYPAYGQMLSTWGFLLQGQILAQLLVIWVTGLLALGTLWALGSAWFSRRVALIAMAVWYGTQSVGYLAASGKIDLAWAAFDFLALASFARWFFARRNERHWRWLALAGFFLGLAAGTKQASVFTGAVLGAAVVVGLWSEKPLRARAGSLVALGVPVVPAAAWVARSYWMTGRLGETGTGLRAYAGPLGFARTIWEMSMLGNNPSPEGPVGKSIGPALLVLLPLLLLLRGVDRRVKVILAFAAVMVALWFVGVPRARHLLPTLALLALVAAYVFLRLLAERWWLGLTAGVLVLAGLGLQLGMWTYVNFASFHRLGYVAGSRTLDQYLDENLSNPWYPNAEVVRYVKANLPMSARIATPSSGFGFYLDRPFDAEWSHTPRDIPDPGNYASRLRASGVTHVFVNDYAVAIRARGDSWLARADFRKRYLSTLICARGQCLYALEPGGAAAS